MEPADCNACLVWMLMKQHAWNVKHVGSGIIRWKCSACEVELNLPIQNGVYKVPKEEHCEELEVHFDCDEEFVHQILES